MLKEWQLAATYYYMTALVVLGGAYVGYSVVEPLSQGLRAAPTIHLTS
ncbi:MAG: hypothetical protein ACREHD_25005 [Pirellulales bacterium]